MSLLKKVHSILIAGVFLLLGVLSACTPEDTTDYFDRPDLAIRSSFTEDDRDIIVVLDSVTFHTGSILSVVYHPGEKSIAKVIIGKKSESQYYVVERTPWSMIGNVETGGEQSKMEYAVHSTHETDGEIKRFCVWQGSYTEDDLKEILASFEQIDVSNIKEPYPNVYLVFY